MIHCLLEKNLKAGKNKSGKNSFQPISKVVLLLFVNQRIDVSFTRLYYMEIHIKQRFYNSLKITLFLNGTKPSHRFPLVCTLNQSLKRGTCLASNPSSKIYLSSHKNIFY